MLEDARLKFINEEFYAEHVSPEQLDELLASGWRHFGTHFFRYNLGLYEFDIRRVIPLRIRLSDFSLSKSQRRVLRLNNDLQTFIRPAAITDDTKTLFEYHKKRFDHSIPDSIYDFVSADPASIPCTGIEVVVYHNEQLIAQSFFDEGENSVSAVYGMFDPTNSNRSLGIFTMLKEIEYAIARGKQFYYQGYCYEGESFYDYKKRFRATEDYDWEGSWKSSEFQL